LRGIIYEKELGKNVSVYTEEFALQAEPYFFSPKVALPTGLLNFRWKQNNKNVGSSDSISLGNISVSGTANISVSVKNTQNIFQSAIRSLQVEFGEFINDELFGI